MANSYAMFTVNFENDDKNIGSEVAALLDNYVDTSLGDLTIDKKTVKFRIALSATKDDILRMCDEVKKELEKKLDQRILYTVSMVNL